MSFPVYVAIHIGSSVLCDCILWMIERLCKVFLKFELRFIFIYSVMGLILQKNLIIFLVQVYTSLFPINRFCNHTN